MQNKNPFYNLRTKLLMALCAILMLGSGLFITQPAQAQAPAKNPARPVAIPVNDNNLSVVTLGVNVLDVFTTRSSDGTVWMKIYNPGIYLGNWSSWTSLGKPANTSLSSVEAVSWASNRIDIFAVDSNKVVWHKAWNGIVGWGTWENIGGGTFPFNRGLQAVSWGSGRIDLFPTEMGGCSYYGPCFGDHFYHKSYSGGWWPSQSGWEILDDSLYAESYVIPWRNISPQWLFIFQRDESNNSLWYKFWNGSSWSAWISMNGAFQGTPYAVSWGSPRLDVFGLGTDSAIYHKSENLGGFPPWSAWESLSNANFGSYPPTAVSWGVNRLDVFETQSVNGGASGDVYRKSWQDGWWWPSQTGWQFIGNAPFFGSPEVVSWGAQRMDLFGRNLDGTVYHKSYDGNSGGWVPAETGPWESLGAP